MTSPGSRRQPSSPAMAPKAACAATFERSREPIGSPPLSPESLIHVGPGSRAPSQCCSSVRRHLRCPHRHEPPRCGGAHRPTVTEPQGHTEHRRRRRPGRPQRHDHQVAGRYRHRRVPSRRRHVDAGGGLQAGEPGRNVLHHRHVTGPGRCTSLPGDFTRDNHASSRHLPQRHRHGPQEGCRDDRGQPGIPVGGRVVLDHRDRGASAGPERGDLAGEGRNILETAESHARRCGRALLLPAHTHSRHRDVPRREGQGRHLRSSHIQRDPGARTCSGRRPDTAGVQRRLGRPR